MKTIFLLLFLSINSFAAIESSKVIFKAIGKPAFLKINGETTVASSDLSLNGELLSGSFEVNLATLDTGIELRDDHLKNNYLEVQKFPKAVITLKDVKVTDGENEVKGILKLHGQEKEIILKNTFSNSTTSISVESNFEISLKDFDIKIPSYQGITVAKNVKVKVDLRIKK